MATTMRLMFLALLIRHMLQLHTLSTTHGTLDTHLVTTHPLLLHLNLQVRKHPTTTIGPRMQALLAMLHSGSRLYRVSMLLISLRTQLLMLCQQPISKPAICGTTTAGTASVATAEHPWDIRVMAPLSQRDPSLRHNSTTFTQSALSLELFLHLRLSFLDDFPTVFISARSPRRRSSFATPYISISGGFQLTSLLRSLRSLTVRWKIMALKVCLACGSLKSVVWGCPEKRIMLGVQVFWVEKLKSTSHFLFANE